MKQSKKGAVKKIISNIREKKHEKALVKEIENLFFKRGDRVKPEFELPKDSNRRGK